MLSVQSSYTDILFDKENDLSYFLNMLTKEQLATLEKMLLEEKDKLDARLKETRERVDFGDDVDSFEEESDEAEEFSNKLGVERLITERMKEVESAILKIEKGGYGICEECGSPISYEVLSVDPESRLCKECKSK